MEWEWGELPLWSLLLYGAYNISEDVLKVSENVLWFKKGIFSWPNIQFLLKIFTEKSLPVGQKKKRPLKGEKHSLKWKFPLKQMQQ